MTLQHLRLIAIYSFIIFGLVFIGAKARSQTIVSNGAGGECTCEHNGKTWPCRKAVDFTKAVSCPAVAIPVLDCPQDKNELCTYHLQNTCPAPATVSVCYAADEPN